MSEPASEARVTADQAVSHELRQLADAVTELRSEVRRSAGAALPRGEAAGWDEDTSVASHAWISSIALPNRAPTRVPRLPFELALIAGAAVLAGVADLRPVEIAAVMGAAWVIVALAEWAGSRGDRMRAQVYLSPIAVPQPPPQAAMKADPTWFTPPVEHTLLASVDDQATAIAAALPAVEDPETTAERRAGA